MSALLQASREPGDFRNLRPLMSEPQHRDDPEEPLIDTNITPPRSKSDMRTRQIAYAFMTALLTLSMFIAIGAVYQAYFNYPPVQIVSLDKPIDTPLCAGMEFSLHNQVSVEEPAILFFYISVMDATANYNIPNTQVALGPRTHPHPSTFMQLIPWTVPDLPPGNYTRVLGVRGTDGDQDAVFLLTPFEIGENC